MPTVKLVVIGSSGVGKTSLRGKYISGRFSNGYRATIGADFITKTIPHPTDPAQTVTLQIWDTAGQERFSSLSTAFFRGADAALLMFDVNAPETMQALKKWWGDFCDKAPVADEDVNGYCCVVVGNKIDMVGSGQESVPESEALEFLDELVPAPSLSSSSSVVVPPSFGTGYPEIRKRHKEEDDALTIIPPTPVSPSPEHIHSSSIAIASHSHNSNSTHSHRPSHSPKHHLSSFSSRSASQFYSGTMTTTHTTLTVYHTPSSSLFDVYQSARSSPEPWSRSTSEVDLDTAATASPTGARKRRMTALSTGSTSSGSAVTITPSLFAQDHEQGQTDGVPTGITTPASGSGFSSSSTSPIFPTTSISLPSPSTIPLPPEHGPKLFFTSAKTGEGVADVFEYIAQRVVRKWEYEEWVEARRMHFREASAFVGAGAERRPGGIQLRNESGGVGGGGLGNCCST